MKEKVWEKKREEKEKREEEYYEADFNQEKNLHIRK